MPKAAQPKHSHDANQRNVGISVPGRPVRVSHDHPRNHDGSTFTVLVTRTVIIRGQAPTTSRRRSRTLGSAHDGYVRPDGTRQRHAIAFQGNVTTTNGETIAEVFVVDIPEDVTQAGDGPLDGTATTRPAPPRGVRQRRLTHTADASIPASKARGTGCAARPMARESPF